LPAPVLGASVLKKVSDVQVRDSAGEPANVATRDDAKMLMLALSTVIVVESVEINNFQIPNESSVSNAFSDVLVPYAPFIGQFVCGANADPSANENFI
jgi:hypothetical protein